MYVGIDLAWTTGRTGLAVLDERGALLDSTTVGSDAEIVTWISSLASLPVVIAVDAPLIVTNASGQRDAERKISKAFGEFKAGAHTTNLAKSGMNPPRAARLADHFGWTKNAQRGSAESPTCIEVYPHPAMVALFGLDERIAYKDKAAFSLEQRRAGFAELIGFLEAIELLALGDSPRWNSLTAAVSGASTKAALNQVEDELDAILCSHLAWLWHNDRDSLHIYGDPNDGYIVAPPPPTRPTRLSPNVRPPRKASGDDPTDAMEALRAFVAERDWAQFHMSENLAKSISIEAAELLELFQWSSDADEDDVRAELADVLTYCLLLADKYGWDPNKLVLDKLDKTKAKYPKDKARGRSTKYDRL